MGPHPKIEVHSLGFLGGLKHLHCDQTVPVQSLMTKPLERPITFARSVCRKGSGKPS